MHNRRKPKLYVPDFMRNKEQEAAINKGSEKRTVSDIKSILALPRGV